MPRFSFSLRASVTSVSPEYRFVYISDTCSPSNSHAVSLPSSNPTIETCTDAPSSVHSRSESAQKIDPLSAIRSRTTRFFPPADALRWPEAQPSAPCHAQSQSAPSQTSNSTDRPREEPEIVPHLKHGVYILVAKLAPKFLSAKERRVAYYHIGSRPVWFTRPALIVDLNHSVFQPYVVQRLKNRRLIPEIECVAILPLEIADPNHCTGQFVGILVRLDSE